VVLTYLGTFNYFPVVDAAIEPKPSTSSADVSTLAAQIQLTPAKVSPATDATNSADITSIQIRPDAPSKAIIALLVPFADVLDHFTVSIDKKDPQKIASIIEGPTYDAGSSDAPSEMACPSAPRFNCFSSSDLLVNRTMDVLLTIKGPTKTDNQTLGSDQLLSTTVVRVPIPNWYLLPVAKAGIFGKLVTAIGLDAAGNLNKLQYAQTVGTGDATGALSALAAAMGPGQRATNDQVQADLIYQHQRLATCLLTSSQCASK